MPIIVADASGREGEVLSVSAYVCPLPSAALIAADSNTVCLNRNASVMFLLMLHSHPPLSLFIRRSRSAILRYVCSACFRFAGPAASLSTCPICLCDIQAGEVFTVDCKEQHTFCVDCLHHHCSVQVYHNRNWHRLVWCGKDHLRPLDYAFFFQRDSFLMECGTSRLSPVGGDLLSSVTNDNHAMLARCSGGVNSPHLLWHIFNVPVLHTIFSACSASCETYSSKDGCRVICVAALARRLIGCLQLHIVVVFQGSTRRVGFSGCLFLQ